MIGFLASLLVGQPNPILLVVLAFLVGYPALWFKVLGITGNTRLLFVATIIY